MAVVQFSGFYDGTDSAPEQCGQRPAGWEPAGGPGKSISRGGVRDPGANAAAELPLGGAAGGEHGQAVPVSPAAQPLPELRDQALVLAASRRSGFASICNIIFFQI